VSHFVTDRSEGVGIGRDDRGAGATEKRDGLTLSVTDGIGWNPRAWVRLPAIPKFVLILLVFSLLFTRFSNHRKKPD
jgi:hypothetical protein